MKFNDAQRLTGLIELLGKCQGIHGAKIILSNDFNRPRKYSVQIGERILSSSTTDLRTALDQVVQLDPDARNKVLTCDAAMPDAADIIQRIKTLCDASIFSGQFPFTTEKYDGRREIAREIIAIIEKGAPQ